MEINFSPELEARLDRIATQQGRDAQALVREAVERLLDYDEWFSREVEKGLEQIYSGEMLEHDEVGKRLEERLAEKPHHR
jgi:predicted transcriptional regulator